MLGTQIILNDLLFEKVFDIKFSGMVPFMSGTWPKNLEFNVEKAKTVIPKPEANLSDFWSSVFMI